MNDSLLKTLFVGIDVSKKSNDVVAMDFHETIYVQKSIKNNLPDARSFINILLDCLQKEGFSFIVIAIESTSIYSTHIATFLAASIELKLYDSKVYVLNPKTTKNYRQTFVNLQKTDPEDSFLLADFARIGKIRSKPWKGDQHLALKRLTRHRQHLIELITREKTYYQTNLFLKFSEFARLSGKDKLFSNNFGATATSVLEELLTLDDIAYMSVENLAEFIIDKSKSHIKNPEKLALRLQKAARDSYKLNKLAYEPITLALASSLNVIKTYRNELKIIDKSIAKVVRGFQNESYLCLLSVPGIGPVIAAGILAEIGDIKAFKNQDSLAQYSGITWSRNQSGPFKSDETHMTKTGNKYLRYYLIEAANLIRRYDPEYRDFYLKKYYEVHTHQHMRAVVLTSRKLIRLIFALLDKNCMYNSQY
jgi:transposase